jgi:hypothetical protein
MPIRDSFLLLLLLLLLPPPPFEVRGCVPELLLRAELVLDLRADRGPGWWCWRGVERGLGEP